LRSWWGIKLSGKKCFGPVVKANGKHKKNSITKLATAVNDESTPCEIPEATEIVWVA